MKNIYSKLKAGFLLISVLLVAALMVIPALVEAGSSLETIIHENFSDNSREWVVRNMNQKEKIDDPVEFFTTVKYRPRNYTATVRDGRYTIMKEKKDVGNSTFQSVIPVNIDENFDFTINTTIEHIGKAGYVGIIWGADQKSAHINSYYGFYIQGDGQYTFGKQSGGKWRGDEWQYKKGMKSRRKITVKKTGKRINFYINGDWVHSTPFEPFFDNKTGFFLKDAEVKITSFEIQGKKRKINNVDDFFKEFDKKMKDK